MLGRIVLGLFAFSVITACGSPTPVADALTGKCDTMCMRATSGGCSSACGAGASCSTLTANARARGCAAQYEALLDCVLANDACSALMGAAGPCGAPYTAYYGCTEPDAGP